MYIIDRLEDEWAVIEDDGQTFNLPRKLLPDNAGEGDVIRLTIEIDQEATRSRRQTINKLVDELFED